MSLLRENYKRSLPILREQFLKDLVSRQMDEKTVEEKLEQYDIPLEGEKMDRHRGKGGALRSVRRGDPAVA